jgi:hypothetical protein
VSFNPQISESIGFLVATSGFPPWIYLYRIFGATLRVRKPDMRQTIRKPPTNAGNDFISTNFKMAANAINMQAKKA